jgi:predicted nucleic acid binding AN1-type Zn finger protein
MEFEYLGAHCEVTNCKQKDFLPFTCDGCSLKFCISHRCYKSHNCKKVPKGIQVITCPLCGTGIDILNESQADYLWNMHYNSGKCNKPSLALKCANITCKVKLNYCNSFKCTHCDSYVCLQHRFPDQHKCREIGAKSGSKCIIC